jgi:hypothetical protein
MCSRTQKKTMRETHTHTQTEGEREREGERGREREREGERGREREREGERGRERERERGRERSMAVRCLNQFHQRIEDKKCLFDCNVSGAFKFRTFSDQMLAQMFKALSFP